MTPKRRRKLQAVLKTGKVLAVVEDYHGFIAALRARVIELGMSYATLDQLAGWADTYATKFLTEEPPESQQIGEKRKTQRALGPMAFDAVLGAVGVKLLVLHDPVALAKVLRSSQYVRKRQTMLPDAKHTHVVHRLTRNFMREIGHIGNIARSEKVSDIRRKEIAQAAANARWARSTEARAAKRQCVAQEQQISEACTRSRSPPNASRAHPSSLAAPQPQDCSTKRSAAPATSQRHHTSR